MSMLMLHTSLHFFVLSFVLACASGSAYVVSEDQADDLSRLIHALFFELYSKHDDADVQTDLNCLFN